MEEKKVVETKQSRLSKATEYMVNNIKNYALQNKLPFTQDETRRLMDGIRVVDKLLLNSNMSWGDLSSNNVESVLQQYLYLNLNASANPRECYFILRNDYNVKSGKSLEFNIEGMGNDALLRNFGVDYYDSTYWVVHEGDLFEYPYYDGWDIVLPKYQPKGKSLRVEKACYLIKTTKGRIEVAIAEREEAKVSLLKHIKQNGATDEMIFDLLKYSLDELLTKPEFVNKKIVVRGKERDLIGYTWKSIDKEKMIERKLRNIATRKYPKNFSNPVIERLYEETFNEEKYNNENVIDAEEIIEDSENDFQNNANAEGIPTESELNVSDDFVVVSEDKVETEKEKSKSDKDIINDYLAQEKAQAEKPKETKQEVPDWF